MLTITPQRVEKIARNINAMDTAYERSDNRRHWRFFSDLDKVLRKKISELSPEDKEAIAELCQCEKAQFFGIAKQN